MDYEKEIERLHSALDVISKFENGDSRDLKHEIRKEIERIESIIDKLESN